MVISTKQQMTQLFAGSFCAKLFHFAFCFPGQVGFP